ncbi:type IV conjugative transfer system protein TraL [Vibrio owensii]|uniref:type IV conjugative transfer system protein TraL n=1 Tax=Vibrio owensii TaxID=696485 RepID=UPI0040694782
MAKNNDINEDQFVQLPDHQTYIPSRINDKQMVAGLEYDTFLIILLIGLTLGSVVKELLLCLLISIVLGMFNGYVKANFPKGRLFHILYWYGVFVTPESKRLKDSFRRKFYR